MKKLIITAIILFLVVVGISVLSSSVYTVGEDQYACVLRFNKIEKVVSEAGLHFKVPFIENINYYSKKVLVYDVAPSSVITKDKMAMTVDFYISWEIQDPLTFFRTLGRVEQAMAKLDTLAYSNVKNLMGTLDQADIINEDDPSERNEIYKKITTNVKQAAEVYGINVKDIKIKRFDLPSENESSVYERMISERNKLAGTIIAEAEKEASFIKTQADVDFDVKLSNTNLEARKLVAQGEEEYMSILAENFNTTEKQEFYKFTRLLEVLKSSLTGDEKTVILNKDSELAKLLIGLELGN